MNPCIKPLSKNFVPFFEWSQDFLKKHNKKLIIKNSRNISFDNGKCSGWCDGKEMAVARHNPLFEQVYVHEFSHMNQAIEESPLWKDDYLFWTHLQNNKVGIKSWDSITDLIALERDCEKRALKISDKWRLFDNEKYSQQANLYLYYYQYVFLKRKWVPSNTIYNKKLVAMMPTKILPVSKFKTVNMDIMMLFEQCLDKKGKYFAKKV